MVGNDIELLEWILLPEEVDFIRANARGEKNLVRYALQICSLRQTGRFITAYSDISLRICNYITKQFQIDLLHAPLNIAHANTESKIKKSVSEFLQFKTLDASAYIMIESWLVHNGSLILDKKVLSTAIEAFLVKEKFILPTSSQLMRKVFSLYSQSKTVEYFQYCCSKFNCATEGIY